MQHQSLEVANQELAKVGSTRMFRASSVGALLATVPSATASTVVQLVEEIEPKVKRDDDLLEAPEVPNNLSTTENTGMESNNT